jgi:cell division protein ZapE
MDALPAPLVDTHGPLPRYRHLLATGALATDPSQALAIERLQDLWAKLRGYDPVPETGGGLFGRLLRRKPADWAPDSRPNGLYLVGEVGRGKSMLMDLFFETATVPRRRRIHFHAFMQEAHRRIHAWRAANPDGTDPVPPLATAIAADAALLCFDELQINDIADAILLGRLFEALFARGVVVVATSNTRPDDLFAGRPGRDAFLPFIRILNRHLDLLILDGEQDWRRHNLRSERVWIVPAGARAEREIDAVFTRLTAGARIQPDRLIIAGRTLDVAIAANGVARFDFAELCGTPRGAGDYLALATHFNTLIIDGVPALSPDNHDVARRFITLVDALYEHRVKLIASADAEPDALYRRGEGASAFERTASRLQEMQTAEYLALPHLT